MIKMELSPDQVKLFSIGPVTINATIVFTWVVMVVLTAGSWLVTRRLTSDVTIPRGQNILEVLVEGIRNQLKEIAHNDADLLLSFVGTFFLFIAVSNILLVVPYFRPPTSSLSTTSALAACVFIMIPVFGISKEGFQTYLKHYTRPSIIMLPFNVISEITRTVALAVRLFGNIMSEGLIAALLLVIVPFFVPVVMHVLGLLTGLVQAYIFAVLAAVYIASGMAARDQEKRKQEKQTVQ